MNARVSIFAVCVLAVGLTGEKCDPFGKGGAGSGETAVTVISDPDSRCAVLSHDAASLAFEDMVSDRIWVVDPIDGVLLPFDVQDSPPVLISADRVSTNTGAQAKLVSRSDGTILQVVTNGNGAASVEEVLRFDPSMLTLELFPFGPVPSVAGITFPQFATDAVAISAVACIDTTAVDSRGDTVEDHTSILCDTTTPGFRTNLAANAAISPTLSGDHLFVTSQNLGQFGDGNPQYFPGTVLVYDLDPLVVPHPTTPAVFLGSFNATGVVSFAAGARNFVLVQTGAIAAVIDDPMTPEVEGGFTAQTAAAIDVIDADDPGMGVVARIALGTVALAPGLVVNPGLSPRIAVVGSLEGRDVYAIDLAALATELLAGNPAPGVVITPGGFGFPGRTTGADPANCPGQVLGLAFNETGDKLFATDFCDGVIAEIAVATTGVPTLSNTTKYVFADRVDSEDETAPKGMTEIGVRPGSTTDAGGDVYVLVTSPEGMVCGLDIDTGQGS